MQKMLILIATFSAITASANCPELAGSFECDDGTETWYVHLETHVTEQDQRAYFMNGDPFTVSDGLTRSLAESENFKNGLIQSICSDFNLINTIEGEVHSDKGLTGEIDFTLTMRLSDRGNLVQRQTGVYYDKSGEDYGFDNLLTCTPMER
ncbi:MAG: hypothetical protein HRT45_12315 [Bdellovibrionales bacterium]|nr:hypothetical protein [Bdellovibrionales bacterium]